MIVNNDSQPCYHNEDDYSKGLFSPEYYNKDPAASDGASTAVYCSSKEVAEKIIDAIIDSAEDWKDGFIAYLAFPGIDYPYDNNKQSSGGIILYDPVGDKIEQYKILADRDNYDETVFDISAVIARKPSTLKGNGATNQALFNNGPRFPVEYSAEDIVDEVISMYMQDLEAVRFRDEAKGNIKFKIEFVRPGSRCVKYCNNGKVVKKLLSLIVNTSGDNYVAKDFAPLQITLYENDRVMWTATASRRSSGWKVIGTLPQ